MFSLIRERRTTAHACLTLGFKGSGFSLLIMVQLRGFGNRLHHQRRLSRYIGLCSVIRPQTGFSIPGRSGKAKSVRVATDDCYGSGSSLLRFGDVIF